MRYSSLPPQELVCVCAQSGEPEAWEEFIQRFHRLIASTVIRTARRWGETSPAVLQDLVQETYLKLCADQCRLLTRFESQHPEAILGYLKVVTANVVHDHFKSLHSEKRGAGNPAEQFDTVDLAASDQDVGSPGAIEREILLKEIDACLCRCSRPTEKRDRMIFWLHYRQGLSARAIASLPSIALSTKGVESTILRLTRLVRRELAQRRPAEAGKQDPDEKDSKATKSF